MRRSHLHAWLVVAIALAAACASSEEEGLFEEEGTGGSSPLDASVGSGGSGSGGTGGVAVDSSASGGSAGLDSSSGFGGAGGSSGVGGAGGSGGSGGSGSCNPAFCPNNGSGAPCCMTPNGPCGSDMGLGCQANAGPDI